MTAGRNRAITRFWSISSASMKLDGWSARSVEATTRDRPSSSSTARSTVRTSASGSVTTATSVITPGRPTSRSASSALRNSTANSRGDGSAPFSGTAYMYSGLAAMPTTRTCLCCRSVPRVSSSPGRVPVSWANLTCRIASEPPRRGHVPASRSRSFTAGRPVLGRPTTLARAVWSDLPPSWRDTSWMSRPSAARTPGSARTAATLTPAVSLTETEKSANLSSRFARSTDRVRSR